MGRWHRVDRVPRGEEAVARSSPGRRAPIVDRDRALRTAPPGGRGVARLPQSVAHLRRLGARRVPGPGDAGPPRRRRRGVARGPTRPATALDSTRLEAADAVGRAAAALAD